MILAAAAELDIDLAASILVGDKASDIAAGRAAGVGRCFRVGADADRGAADAVFADLSACVAALA
jgi:D-glycero-D-manno-heptose 1,7-bisphosphate phosphatase